MIAPIFGIAVLVAWFKASCCPKVLFFCFLLLIFIMTMNMINPTISNPSVVNSPMKVVSSSFIYFFLFRFVLGTTCGSKGIMVFGTCGRVFLGTGGLMSRTLFKVLASFSWFVVNTKFESD